MTVAPLKPPREWFETPEADEPTPLTFTPEGQVYGHLALWDTCHLGFNSGPFSECVKPPRSQTGYQMFHTGQIETADGSMVAVGHHTYGTGHAPVTQGLQAAVSHYDNTGSVGAFVRATEGRHGIWLSGAVRSDATPEGLRDMRASPPSGDWRPYKGNLELVSSLSVVFPGYPVPRSAQMSLAASGVIESLILPGVMEADLVEARSKEYLRRRHALSAAISGD